MAPPSGEEGPNSVDNLTSCCSVTGQHTSVNLLRYAPESGHSPINFNLRAVHFDIINNLIYSPTDAPVSCLKNQY